MIYSEQIGNLFHVSSDFVLAHCISKDCALGAGIAKQFDRRYPLMRENLLSQKRKVTDVILYESENNHSVFNLITKEKYYHKPTRENFNSTIINLKNKLIELDAAKLAIPLLGAGLDKLDWYESEAFIKECFSDTPIEILVVRLE